MIAALFLSAALAAEPKWEYHREIIQVHYYGDVKAIKYDVDVLERAGKAGWELVSVVCMESDCSYHLLYFKRKLK